MPYYLLDWVRAIANTEYSDYSNPTLMTNQLRVGYTPNPESHSLATSQCQFTFLKMDKDKKSNLFELENVKRQNLINRLMKGQVRYDTHLKHRISSAKQQKGVKITSFKKQMQ